MKKNYKEYGKMLMGVSDVARVILATHDRVEFLNFGEDGRYEAYIVDEDAEMDAKYDLRFETDIWLKVYDDDGLTLDIKADKILVYRAGERGCIVQTIGRSEVYGL